MPFSSFSSLSHLILVSLPLFYDCFSPPSFLVINLFFFFFPLLNLSLILSLQSFNSSYSHLSPSGFLDLTYLPSLHFSFLFFTKHFSPIPSSFPSFSSVSLFLLLSPPFLLCPQHASPIDFWPKHHHLPMTHSAHSLPRLKTLKAVSATHLFLALGIVKNAYCWKMFFGACFLCIHL